MNEENPSELFGGDRYPVPRFVAIRFDFKSELGRRRWIKVAKAAHLDPDRFISWMEEFERGHTPVPSEQQGSPPAQLPGPQIVPAGALEDLL